MKIYTAIEAAAKTSISKRTIQYKCKRDNIRKKLNVYQITDDVLNKWIEEDANNPRKVKIARATAHEEVTHESFSYGQNAIEQDRIRIEEKELALNAFKELDKARLEIKELKNQLEDFDPEAELKDYLPEIEGVPLEQIEAFEFQFKRSGEEEVKKGNLLFIQKGMVSIEYTPEEFDNVKLNLENYKLLELKIKHLDELHTANLEKAVQAEKNKDKLHASEVKNKDEVHAVELLKAKESETHYKNIYYYTRKQNSDFTRMHEKVIEVVMLSGKENMIKTVKDAKNTEWKK